MKTWVNSETRKVLQYLAFTQRAQTNNFQLLWITKTQSQRVARQNQLNKQYQKFRSQCFYRGIITVTKTTIIRQSAQ